MDRIKRILVTEPGADDTASFCRSVMPLTFIQKNMREIDIVINPALIWSNVMQSDIVFMHRPTSTEHTKFASLVKKCGVPLWIDYSDDVLNVPVGNRNFDYFDDPEIQENIRFFLQEADAVTTSNEYLVDLFSAYSDRVELIDMELNDEFLKWRTAGPRNKTIVWRGLGTVKESLDHFTPQILSVADKYPDYKWVFCGYKPFNLLKQLGSRGAHLTLGVDPVPVGYYELMNDMKPAVHLVIRKDDPFSRGRGNESWLEGAFGGAVSVAPNFPHFIRPGVFNYTQEDGSFDYTLSKVLDRDKTYDTTKDFQYLLEHNLSSIVNRKRLAILDRLIKGVPHG